jgi:hypothetical protein
MNGGALTRALLFFRDFYNASYEKTKNEFYGGIIMKVNANEMQKMIEDSYAPGHEMIKAINMLDELATEFGFKDEPRFKEANTKLVKSMMEFQTMSFDRGMDLCRANAVINKLNETTISRHLVTKAKKELGY